MGKWNKCCKLKVAYIQVYLSNSRTFLLPLKQRIHQYYLVVIKLFNQVIKTFEFVLQIKWLHEHHVGDKFSLFSFSFVINFHRSLHCRQRSERCCLKCHGYRIVCRIAVKSLLERNRKNCSESSFDAVDFRN